MANIALTARDEKFIAAMRNSAGAVGELSAKLNVNLKNAFKEVDYVSRNFNSGLTRLGSDMKSFGSTMTAAVTLPMALMGAGILKTYGDIEKLKIGLDLYGVSLQEIKQIAKTPGLGIEEAARSVQMLADARFNIDLSKKAVVEFGNALAMAGRGKEELEGVFRAFSQIKGKGKVQAEEINQIAERLPIIRQLMVDIFGTADTEKLQKMGLGADEFLAKITERLAEMPRVAGGFQNSLGNVGDALKIAAFEFGETANKIFNFEAITTSIASAIEGVTSWFKGLSPEIQKTIFAVSGLVFIAGPLIALFGGIISIIPVFLTGISALAAPIAMVAAGATLIIANWDKISPYFSSMATSIGIIFNEIKTVILHIWNSVHGQVVGVTGSMLGRVTEIFSIGLRGVAEVFRLFGGILTGDGDKIKLAFTNIFKTLWNAVVSIFQTGIVAVLGLTAALFDAFGADENAAKIRKFSDGLISWVDTFKAKLKDGKAEVLSFGAALKNLGGGGGDTGGGPYDRTDTSKATNAKKKDFNMGGKLTGFAFAGQRAEKFGKENAEAISGILGTDITKSASVLENRFKDLTNKMKESFKDLGKVAIEEGTGIMVSFNETIQNIGADFLSNAFEGIFSGNGLGGAMKGLLTSLGGAVQQMGKQFLLASAAVEKMKITFGTALGPGGAIAAIALGGLIKSMAGNIEVPALANGGLAYGPTYAMVGDNRNAGVDPEVIAPLSKLKSIMGNSGGGDMVLTTKLMGQDLLLMIERAKRSQ